MSDCNACPAVAGRARVSGWQYPRRVLARPCAIVMEIGLEGCTHCPTCKSRVAGAKAALSSKGIAFECDFVNDGTYFTIPQPKEPVTTPEAICDYLSQVLDLEVAPA